MNTIQQFYQDVFPKFNAFLVIFISVLFFLLVLFIIVSEIIDKKTSLKKNKNAVVTDKNKEGKLLNDNDKIKNQIILSENGNDFYVILHACPNTVGNYQWYVTDDPNSETVEKIDGMTCEALVLSCDEIKKHYQNKWVYCNCLVDGYSYNEGCVYLTEDFISIIKENKLAPFCLLWRKCEFLCI